MKGKGPSGEIFDHPAKKARPGQGEGVPGARPRYRGMGAIGWNKFLVMMAVFLLLVLTGFWLLPHARHATGFLRYAFYVIVLSLGCLHLSLFYLWVLRPDFKKAAPLAFAVLVLINVAVTVLIGRK